MADVLFPVPVSQPLNVMALFFFHSISDTNSVETTPTNNHWTVQLKVPKHEENRAYRQKVPGLLVFVTCKPECRRISNGVTCSAEEVKNKCGVFEVCY